jgi:hypothetical protein
MELSSKTKVAELLLKYPFLKEFLIAMDPQFKALDSPIMMKTLGRIATLGKAAMITGTQLEKLMPAIAEEVKKQTGEVLAIKREGAGKRNFHLREDRVLKGSIRDRTRR